MMNSFGGINHESRSVSDQVCDTIRKLIIDKAIPSGERLVETKIAKELDVSITPVRQAFAQLANEGLLTVYPFKGTYVTDITYEYVKNVIDTRIILERGAVELCFDMLTDEDAEQLIAYTFKSDEYCTNGFIFEATEEDLNFHEHFFLKGENELLMRMWKIVKTRIQYIQSYTKPRILPPDYLMKRHSGMINALQRRNKKLFIKMLMEHIETSFDFSYFDTEKS
jgi:DNA-binding GntR family transcriptional regulator